MDKILQKKANLTTGMDGTGYLILLQSKEHSPGTKKTSGKYSPFARYGAIKEHAFGERNTLASLLCFGSKGTQGDGLASAAADLN